VLRREWNGDPFTKISEAFYEASATPPQVREAWSTSAPLRLQQLCDELVALKAHQTDIGDAIDDADREWLISGRSF
jgi:hypothetical protein